MDDGLAILVLIAAGWFWWDSRGVAERASQLARQRCEQLGLAFLNDTVAWKKIRLKRNKLGRMQFQRTYFFEFTSGMHQRYQGEIVMLGQTLTHLDMEAYRVDNY
jgi:hypothetical protein